MPNELTEAATVRARARALVNATPAHLSFACGTQATQASGDAGAWVRALLADVGATKLNA
jgi:hypothetical protein